MPLKLSERIAESYNNFKTPYSHSEESKVISSARERCIKRRIESLEKEMGTIENKYTELYLEEESNNFSCSSYDKLRYETRIRDINSDLLISYFLIKDYKKALKVLDFLEEEFEYYEFVDIVISLEKLKSEQNGWYKKLSKGSNNPTPIINLNPKCLLPICNN